MNSTAFELLSRQVASVLQEVLPLTGASWWQERVVDRLSLQQQGFLMRSQQSSLDQLDLASLLRVLDQNWFEVASAKSLDVGVRNWAKEAQTIRNRWAHVPIQGIPPEDEYRDLDTIERLCAALGALAVSIDPLRKLKSDLLTTIAKVGSERQPAAKGVDLGWKSGTMVRLKASPMTVGAIVDVVAGDSQDRLKVFHDGAIHTYYASQVENQPVVGTKTSASIEEMHAALTALQLRHPSISNLYSLHSSRIQFVPYQFRPVIKLIRADRPRLLIADEVGVGKTIEAGLILKELQARRDIRSVLVICPKPLVAERKWMEELKRFDEQFVHLDGAALRYCVEETHLEGTWPSRFDRCILPFSLLDETLLVGDSQGRKKIRGLLQLETPPSFDLVIVDEAHHIRNTDTWAYRNVRFFCDNAEAVVLLSATPIQLGDNDLFTLLNLLRPDIIPSRREFDQMSGPNPSLNIAVEAARGAQDGWKTRAKNAVDKALKTSWGEQVLANDPQMSIVRDILESDTIGAESRLSLIRSLEELHTFAPLINRTRRRDIGNFTVRKPETVSVDFTQEQNELHTDLLELIARMLENRHGEKNLTFMMTTLRRQLASCVFGLAPLLSDILGRHLSELDWSELGDGEETTDWADTLSFFQTEVSDLVRRCDRIVGPDPKVEAFLQVVHEKQAVSNNKLLVFSTFRHTLAYLLGKLSQRPCRVGLIQGDVQEFERRDLRRRFSLPKEDPLAIDVLLSSEVGCEGLDFQFCDTMVNYDLPWNPMRVEQRIGRIDRYGQRSPTVAIYNFITTGTVDAEIYDRCLSRIGVFRQALGGSEEILGKLTRKIHAIAENQTLTEEERAARFQQLADNEIRLIQEESMLEEEQTKFFGLTVPAHDSAMVEDVSSFWLAPSRLANLVQQYLVTKGLTELPTSWGKKPVSTLQLSAEIRKRLLVDFSALKLTGAVAQEWLQWLRGNDPHFSLTFESAVASDRRDLALINAVHPLVRQAAVALQPASKLVCCVHVTAPDVPSGRYPFAVYRWNELGLRDSFSFCPVCTSPEVETKLTRLLESARPAAPSIGSINTEEEEELERKHYRKWLDQRATHVEQVAQAGESRLASLKTTHSARLAMLEDQRDEIDNVAIRRMRESQIETAKRDYLVRAEALKEASTRADIVAELVVFGVIVVGG